MRELVKVALENMDFKVVQCANAAEALQTLRMAQDFCLMITDYNMPGDNGLQLVSKVRANPVFAGMPILMLSTEWADDLKHKAKAVGASGWMVKPFGVETFRKTIGRVVR